jgi:hypothetical protein
MLGSMELNKLERRPMNDPKAPPPEPIDTVRRPRPSSIDDQAIVHAGLFEPGPEIVRE